MCLMLFEKATYWNQVHFGETLKHSPINRGMFFELNLNLILIFQEHNYKDVSATKIKLHNTLQSQAKVF